MPRGIVIPVDESESPFWLTFTDYTDYQKVVGGTFEVIDLTTPPASLYVNDEGKLIGLPVNRRATLLLWLNNPAFFMKDVVCGPAVLIGPADAEGATMDLPAELSVLILGTDLLKVEVQTINEPGKWYGNQARYSEYFEAANAALSLYQRWTLAEAVRVVAA